MERSAVDSFRSGALNMNSWLLSLQHAFSCGVDFTMCNGAAIYFVQRFDQPVVKASAIAFLYGISALFARGLGGHLSDKMSERLSLRGRLLAQSMCMLCQGLLNVWFARIDDLIGSILLMVVFSIFVQASQPRNSAWTIMMFPHIFLANKCLFCCLSVSAFDGYMFWNRTLRGWPKCRFGSWHSRRRRYVHVAYEKIVQNFAESASSRFKCILHLFATTLL
jgi:nitrate/nitrite transporter NarK